MQSAVFFIFSGTIVRMKRDLLRALVCGTILLVIFFTLDPAKTPSFVLIIPFLLMFFLLFSIARKGLDMAGYSGLTGKKLAVLGASMPVLLLVLQSVGQLTVRDVLVVSILFCVAWFYILRAART